jgi:putative toxin-antitoxin system antitoxin component (TIGR02293 family)
MADPIRIRHVADPAPTYTELLGLRSSAPLQVAERVREGLGYASFERFRRHAAVSAGELATLVSIPDRTLARRKRAGRLEPEESDRLVRLARVFAQALLLFEGNVAATRRWLATPLAVLGSATPLHTATTDPGAREVEALIGRLEHGIPA